jgi:hypothetical protein
MTNFFAINTIGLTGAEILASYLAQCSNLKILPGQNFLQFGKNLYRKHYFNGRSSQQIFNEFNADLLRKNGSIWAGPVKNMSPSFKTCYDRDKHMNFFAKEAKAHQDFQELTQTYTKSFFDSLEISPSDVDAYGYWGANFCITHLNDRKPDQAYQILNLSNSPSVWLSNISQKMIWNNAKSLTFYIIHNLIIRYLKKLGYKIHDIDLEDLTHNKQESIFNCLDFLGVSRSELQVDHPLKEAYLSVDTSCIQNVITNAKQLHYVYKDFEFYKVACSIDEWSTDYLSNMHHLSLLQLYISYWNSTCHTNFDFVGPLESEIMNSISLLTDFKSSRNFSFSFYHDCITFDSDSFHQPTTSLTHYLGTLEEQIVVPRNPYYIRAIITYLDSVISTFKRQMHSFTPLSNSVLWNVINQEELKPLLEASGLYSDVRRIRHAMLAIQSSPIY